MMLQQEINHELDSFECDPQVYSQISDTTEKTQLQTALEIDSLEKSRFISEFMGD